MNRIDLCQTVFFSRLTDSQPSITSLTQSLNSILDDILDFGQSSGISNSATAAERRVEDVDLSRVIEDLSTDELEHLHLTNLIDDQVSNRLHQASRLGEQRSPELIIKMNPLLENQRWRVDRTSLQKILKKIVNNALRFTESGYVLISINPTQLSPSSTPSSEHLICFTIQDTGPGSKCILLASLISRLLNTPAQLFLSLFSLRVQCLENSSKRSS